MQHRDLSSPFLSPALKWSVPGGPIVTNLALFTTYLIALCLWASQFLAPLGIEGMSASSAFFLLFIISSSINVLLGYMLLVVFAAHHGPEWGRAKHERRSRLMSKRRTRRSKPITGRKTSRRHLLP
jgi:hypothetical protein